MSALLEPFRELVRRRLWPVAILLIAAAVAVPKLLVDSASAPVATPAAAAEDDGPFATTAITTAAVTDGTERRRVLGALKDPFRPSGKQPRKKSVTATASAPAGTTDPAGNPVGPSGVSDVPGGPDGAPVPGSGPVTPVDGDPSPSTPKATVPSSSLRVAFDEQERMLERLEPLPDADTPQVIYLGLLQDDKTAVFLLDASVTTEGDGACRPTPEDCQRLYLKKGETAFFEVAAAADGTAGEQHQLDLLAVHGKRSASSSSSKAGSARTIAASTAGRRALRARIGRVGRLRYDARTGRLRDLSSADRRRSPAR